MPGAPVIFWRPLALHPWHPAITPRPICLAPIDSRFNRFLGQPRSTFTTRVTGEARTPRSMRRVLLRTSPVFRGPVDEVFSRPAHAPLGEARHGVSSDQRRTPSCGLLPLDQTSVARTASATPRTRRTRMGCSVPSRGARNIAVPSSLISFSLLRVGQTPDPALVDTKAKRQPAGASESLRCYGVDRVTPRSLRLPP